VASWAEVPGNFGHVGLVGVVCGSKIRDVDTTEYSDLGIDSKPCSDISMFLVAHGIQCAVLIAFGFSNCNEWANNAEKSDHGKNSRNLGSDCADDVN